RSKRDWSSYVCSSDLKKNLVLVAVIYGALSVVTRNNFFLFFGIWMMGFYSLSSFSLDAASCWGRYARSLPISDRQIVGAKFLAEIGRASCRESGTYAA